MNVPKRENSQIEGPSICNSYGFKVSMQNLQEAKALHEVGFYFCLVRTAFITLSDWSNLHKNLEKKLCCLVFISHVKIPVHFHFTILISSLNPPAAGTAPHTDKHGAPCKDSSWPWAWPWIWPNLCFILLPQFWCPSPQFWHYSDDGGHCHW